MNERFRIRLSASIKKILDFQHLSFLDKQENLIFIGNPGVGKSYLAIDIGVAACEQGVRILFINCHELLLRLQSARMRLARLNVS